MDKLAMPESCSVPDAIAALEPHGRVPAVKAARDWVDHADNVRSWR